MTEPSPRDRWMEDFLSQLSYGSRASRRVRQEIEDHLDDEISRLVAEGIDRQAAERQAIDAFGEPSDIARAFESEVGPGLPKLGRWTVPLGIVLVLPSLLFVVGNFLKFNIGKAEWVYDSTFGTWMHHYFLVDAFINFMIPLAPLLALVLVTSSSANMQVQREGTVFRTKLAVHLTKGMVAIAAVSLVILLAMASYFILENGPCWWGITWC